MRRLEFLLVVLCMAGCSSPLPRANHLPSTRQHVVTMHRSENQAHIIKVSVPGRPFESIASRHGHWVFVSLMPGAATQNSRRTAGGVGVFRWTGTRLVLTRVVPVPPDPTGMVLSHDGRLLVVADWRYVDFFDVARLVRGAADSLLGSIRDAVSPSSVYVAITPDDRTLFVSDESVSTVTVINLQRARRNGFRQRDIVPTP